jgi:hypothetical protein
MMRVALVTAAALVGGLLATASANAATPTPLVSVSTNAPGSGGIVSGTQLTVTFNEAPVLASSYSLTLADGSDTGTLSTADGNLSASVSGDSINFTAHGAPAGGTIDLGNLVEIVSATGISDGSGNPWDLVASGEVDKRELLAAGDQVVVTYDEAVTANPASFSLALSEGEMGATIDQSDASIDSASSGDTVIYDVNSSPSGNVPTDPPTVDSFTGVTQTTLTDPAPTVSSDSVNVDPDTTCFNISGLTRVFGGSNCDITNSGPVAPDVYDVIPLPTTDLPGAHPTNGDPANDDNAPEVITNCEAGSTDTVYDLNTGAELGQNLCGNNPPEQDIGNTNSATLDYIPTPNLESYEEVGVVESFPGSGTYVSPTAVPPQLSGIDLNGSQATFHYYTPVVCQAGSGDYDTLSQYTYESPYTDTYLNANSAGSGLVYPSSLSCDDPSDSGGSTSITVTYPDPIPTTGVRFKFTGYGPGHFIIGSADSPFAYEREASESAYAGPSATITSFTPPSTTLASSAGGTVNVSFATTDALTCTLGAVSNPPGAGSLSLPSAASCGGSGTITVPANTSDTSNVVYTVTLTAQGVASTPAAFAEITITVPPAPAPPTPPTITAPLAPAPIALGVDLFNTLIKTHHGKATFHFGTTGGATSVECALVRLPTKKGKRAPKPKYVTCGSTKTFRHLGNGHYVLYVRAVDAGVFSKTITREFTIKLSSKSKKHHG